jgi:hypothetical protein
MFKKFLGILIAVFFAITGASGAFSQTYAPGPLPKTHVIGEAFRKNNLRYMQFNRCTDDGNLYAACKQGTPENALILNKPTGTFTDGTPTGKGAIKGYRSDDEPFTWVNDGNLLTLSFSDRNKSYFVVDGHYLVDTVNENDPFSWKVLVNQK